MNYLIKIIVFVFCVFALFIPRSEAAAAEYVTIVNPIRGNDFWEHDFQVLETPRKQYELIDNNDLSATWLVRFDTLLQDENINFLKSLNSKQELGIFFEITPSLTGSAGVRYNQSESWHFAKSVFLIGYTPTDRIKLIDKTFESFREKFGYYPKSVGAWWIDAYSLNYMREKYSVTSNMVVADQYTTDGYQVWGQYWSLPYYPSKLNALMPAQSGENKNGVVTIQWAHRDPFNGYGNGVGDSTFSVQANDYMLHDLDVSYFEKLLNIYPQVTVGLENDFSFAQFGEEYSNQINLLNRKQILGEMDVVTMSEFSQYYNQTYPDISPSVLLSSEDPLGGTGKVVWYQTPKYRVGWFHGSYGSVIRDLRVLSDSSKEECYDKACETLNLANSFVNALDDVSFSTRWVIDEGRISDFKVIQKSGSAEISYGNQSGDERLIKFLPNDVEVNGKIFTLASVIANASQNSHQDNKNNGMMGGYSLIQPNILQDLSLGFGKYILLTFFFFLIPGWVLTNRFLLSIPVGWALFTLLNFLTLSFGIKSSLPLLILPLVSLFIIYKQGIPKIPVLKINFHNFILGLLIFFGSCSWLLTNVKNGLIYEYGMGFWGPNGHDAIWHLGLISQIQKGLPPQNPIFAGERLDNYHYFYDLLLASSSSLFSINPTDLLFRFFPLLISILSGLLIFSLVKMISRNYLKKSEDFSFISGIFSVFLLYFGGSFGWIVSFFKDRSLGGETLFWAQQGVSTLLNPPFAISLVLILTGLYLFLDFLKKEEFKFWEFSNLKLLMPLILVWGTLIEFKAYAGVLVLASLGLLSLEYLVFKKDARILFIFLPILILSLLVFLPNNLSGSSLFIISPLWLTNSMVLFPDRLNWQRLALAMQSDSLFKIVLSNALAVLIFLMGNLGTRIVVGITGIKTLPLRFLIYIGIIGFILPLIFIQTGTNWNIIQFFYYTIFIFNILAGITLAEIWQRFKISKFIVILIMLLTLPTTFDTLKQYYPERPPSRLTLNELEALEFLKDQSDGTVLNLEFDKNLKNQYSEPLPLFVYAPTAYIPAFSSHSVFIDDTINLDILGVDYKGRLNLQRDFVKIKDKSKEVLKENNISYLYVLKSQKFEEDEGRMGIVKIYENDEVKIFKVL